LGEQKRHEKILKDIVCINKSIRIITKMEMLFLTETDKFYEKEQRYKKGSPLFSVLYQP
jgi:hypothetical protein